MKCFVNSPFICSTNKVGQKKKEGKPSFSRPPCRPLHSSRSGCWSTLISRATRLRAAQEFGVARSYPTLVGLGGGHCLAAFCLALLMDILYRKVCSLSTVTFICRTNKIPAASSQLLARDPASSRQLVSTSSQALLQPWKSAQASRARRCADHPLGRSGPFGCLYYTIKGLFCQPPSYLLNK